jgi:hypothetical protein
MTSHCCDDLQAVFAEYLEMMEYNNIQTRMLGANSFPYRNIEITDEVLLTSSAQLV